MVNTIALSVFLSARTVGDGKNQKIKQKIGFIPEAHFFYIDFYKTLHFIKNDVSLKLSNRNNSEYIQLNFFFRCLSLARLDDDHFARHTDELVVIITSAITPYITDGRFAWLLPGFPAICLNMCRTDFETRRMLKLRSAENL